LISHVEAQAYIGFWHKADMPVVLSEAIAAVVFDLDGVLLNSGSDWDAAWRKVAARNGGRWRADATRVMMGMSSPEWSRYMHDQLGVPLEPEQINELVVAALLDQFRRRLPLLPGAVAAVRRLANRWPLGLASSANRPVIDAVLERAGITDRFAVTVSDEEVAAGKPAPDVYLAATRRLGVEPADAVAVEDSTNGLRAAAAAGMVVIASPYREYPPEPDALALAALVVKSLDELTQEAVESAAQRARQQRASG
jgi:HAD superfamily hydrolase (TIGR01509 family)